MASHVARANLNGAMLMVSVRKIAAYQNASTVWPTRSPVLWHMYSPIRAIPKVNASVYLHWSSLWSDPICGQSCGTCKSGNGAMLMVSVRKIAAYQNVAWCGGPVCGSRGACTAPIRAIPKVNASVLSCTGRVCGPDLYVGSLVVLSYPRFALPVNASVLRTALVAFVVLILYVGSLVVVVAFILTAMMMAGVFPVTTVSNGTNCGGSFQMGSDAGDSDEKPVHSLAIPTFEMSKTEVTFKQYLACVSAVGAPQPMLMMNM